MACAVAAFKLKIAILTIPNASRVAQNPSNAPSTANDGLLAGLGNALFMHFCLLSAGVNCIFCRFYVFVRFEAPFLCARKVKMSGRKAQSLARVVFFLARVDSFLGATDVVSPQSAL